MEISELALSRQFLARMVDRFNRERRDRIGIDPGVGQGRGGQHMDGVGFTLRRNGEDHRRALHVVLCRYGGLAERRFAEQKLTSAIESFWTEGNIVPSVTVSLDYW